MTLDEGTSFASTEAAQSRSRTGGEGSPSSLRRIGLVVAVGAICAVAGGGVAWAALTALTPPEEATEAVDYTSATVVEGEVGSSLAVNATARWTPTPVGVNRAAGTVTTVDVAPGAEVAAGTRLYTVDLRPVTIAAGGIPAFRTMAQGTTGRDVMQLQSLLTSLGLFTGTADGTFGAATVASVKAWQKTLGVSETGTVEVGDIVFVSALPVRVALEPTLAAVGTQLSGGEKIVSALPASPVFALPVAESQATLIPDGTRIVLSSPSGGEWEAVASSRSVDAEGNISIALAGRDGASICADTCSDVSVSEPAIISSQAITVETTTGLTVPTGALKSGADGDTYLITTSGAKVPVKVIASARGLSIVSGAEEGISVRIPAIEG